MYMFTLYFSSWKSSWFASEESVLKYCIGYTENLGFFILFYLFLSLEATCFWSQVFLPVKLEGSYYLLSGRYHTFHSDSIFKVALSAFKKGENSFSVVKYNEDKTRPCNFPSVGQVPEAITSPCTPSSVQ